jgi:hypothetical protein
MKQLIRILDREFPSQTVLFVKKTLDTPWIFPLCEQQISSEQDSRRVDENAVPTQIQPNLRRPPI